MELQVGVKAVISNKEGKYLLLRRSRGEARGVWDIAGGRIDPGVPLRENLIREIKEETGLDFDGGEKIIAAQDIFPSNGDRHIVRITYAIEMDGTPVLNPEEHDEFRWVSFSELKSLPGLDAYLKELIDSGAFKESA
ncbi:MAG TPA: NUDIX hydrolase [Candidatus Paceibacterota bacterium]|nr:NUDIX hydrolase [Candidatus Paceibacterota bacterium]